ncbi:MAG TPA: protein kinase [Anaeromyxobacteraceae bacterium]|nr:protein kinase [Anaeromyxobacteraceae bacterium]
MPLCAKCQREGPEGALFCPFCSAPILASREAEAGDPLIGQTIKGTYLVQQRIGSGGMGQVYKAVQINLDRPVALKLLRPSFLSDQTIVQRFHREARAASRLHHPNVISVTDFGQTEDGTLFMAMEYLPGRNLLKLMAEEFPLGEQRVLHLASQILSALAEAHRAGIVHRDLKPENVMVESRRGEPDFVKVLDFGIAKIQEPDDREGRLTQTGLIFGTPDYMSPEQATLVPLDARSDLYSVGVMLYEMLTGRHPFQAATPPAMAQAHVVQPPPPMSERCPPGHRVSPALEALAMRALAKKPEDRFETAEEMRRQLLDCPLDPGLGEGRTAPERIAPTPSPRTPATPGSAKPQSQSSAGPPRSATPSHTGRVGPTGPSAISPPRTPLPAPTLPSEAAPRTPPGRRPVPLTEPLVHEAEPPPPSEGPPTGARARSRLPLVVASSGLAVLAIGGFLAFGRSAGEKRPAPVEPAPLAERAPEPQPPVTIAQPSPAAAAPVPRAEKPLAAPAAEPGPAPKAGAAGPPTSGAASPRGQKGKRAAAAPKGQHAPRVASTAGEASRAAPSGAATSAPAPAAPAPSTPPPAQGIQRQALVTREVLGFRQLLGDPGLKERGLGLVDKARWVLEPNGTLTFAPADKAPGFFPMTVHASRDGDRVWFDGTRTASASSGLAYVRISGELASAAAERVLTLDLEFGRALGADGTELEPTYRARARLRLAAE